MNIHINLFYVGLYSRLPNHEVFHNLLLRTIICDIQMPRLWSDCKGVSKTIGINAPCPRAFGKAAPWSHSKAWHWSCPGPCTRSRCRSCTKPCSHSCSSTFAGPVAPYSFSSAASYPSTTPSPWTAPVTTNYFQPNLTRFLFENDIALGVVEFILLNCQVRSVRVDR